MSTNTEKPVSHKIATICLTVLVAYIQWRDGYWTVRGQIALWLRERISPAVTREVSRR